MITRLLGKIGLPVLIKVLSLSLLRLNNETAQKAGQALDDVGQEITRREISPEQIAEADRHLVRGRNINLGLDRKAREQINRDLRQEILSEDKFVRFWRPAFGYSVAIAWLLNMLTICYVVITDSGEAAEIISALMETASLWGLALGVLGVSVVKSAPEKRTKKTKSTGLLTRVVKKMS